MFELACYGQMRLFDCGIDFHAIGQGIALGFFLVTAIAVACTIGFALKKLNDVVIDVG
jgi:hypothetical protein